ncbi:MAG: hypothetical protein AB1656_07435 [Candidatus Omnitrophota bacterium]
MRIRAILAARRACRRPRVSRLAVLVSDFPRSREAKIAYGLQQNGWKVVLLHKEEPTFDPAQYCAEHRSYRSSWEALLLASQYSPVVYHVFSCWNFNTAELFVRHRPGKIVFDDYDVLAGMVDEERLESKYPKQLNKERYCLENADGLCCRSIETQYAKRHHGYKYSGSRIFFPEMCWNTDFHTPKKNDFDKFCVALVGNLSINADEEINHPNNYHLQMALYLSQYSVYVRMYCPVIDKNEPFLQQLMQTNSFISRHWLSPDRLIQDMFFFCHGGMLCCPSVESDAMYRRTKRNYGIGNKVFDFIDAELPIFYENSGRFMDWLLYRYRLTADLSDLLSNPSAAVSQMQNRFSANAEHIKKQKRHFSIVERIKRLIDFYENV